jgi:regulation of enolase protein 1 (concanavalin A-like superfamily)
METVENNYMNVWFINSANDQIKDSTTVGSAFASFGESTTAWNRQMMFLNGYQRLSECHAILGDNPGKVAFYDAIVVASVSWFESEWQNTTGGGQACYVWQYAPGHAGGNEEMNLHAAYDLWGLNRAFLAGKYGLTQSLMRPFAETLRHIIYQGNNTFAEWVNGDTSTTRNYIYPEWMGIAAYDPCTFAIMANADIAQGSQGSTPIFDALILWVKNNRALGVYAGNCDAADFSLSSPWVESVTQGNNASYAVTVNDLDGFSGSVALSMSGLPNGVTASFTSGNNSTLTLSASSSAVPGVYAATITGTGSGIVRTVPVTLTVEADTAPDFSISATPTTQGVAVAGATTYSVNIGALNGFSGSVSLAASGLPTGASAGFNPGSVTGSGSSTLTITTGSSTPAGSYSVTMTGTSGSLTHNATVTLSVNDFSISASPSSQTVTAGNNTTYTVNVGNVNGFGGTVNFSASGLPSGVTANFNPASGTAPGSSTLTVTTSSSTAAGTYTLTLTGVSGTLAHSTTVSLIVNAASGGLPAGWSDTDVGTPSLAGSASYSAGVFTIKGSGADIYGTADQFHFAYESTSGDQTVIARIASQTGANGWAKTGVMIRESTNAGASYVGLYVTPANGVSMQYRNGTGTSAVDLARHTGVAAPYWVKLVRSGSTFTGYNSADGSTWTQVGTTSFTMATAGLAGLAVCSHDNTALNTAAVDNVSITAPAPDFSIAASPSSQTVAPGGSTNYTATISALNGFSSGVSLTVSGLPSGATGSFNPPTITGSGSSTLTVSTASSTPIGTSTLTITGTSGSLVHNATVTLVVANAATNSNIAPSGTAYGWSGMGSSAGNSNRVAMPGMNDNNLTVNVDIQPNGDFVGAWEAAGVVWSSGKTIISVDIINGDITSGGDGFLTANLKLQFSTDGSAWTDSNWTVSPAYPYSGSAGGKTYTFSGTAVSGKFGARVIGQVRTTDTSYHWIVKEVQVTGH